MVTLYTSDIAKLEGIERLETANNGILDWIKKVSIIGNNLKSLSISTLKNHVKYQDMTQNLGEKSMLRRQKKTALLIDWKKLQTLNLQRITDLKSCNGSTVSKFWTVPVIPTWIPIFIENYDSTTVKEEIERFVGQHETKLHLHTNAKTIHLLDNQHWVRSWELCIKVEHKVLVKCI